MSYGISIWPTSGCNLRCRYCYYDKDTVPIVDIMTEETADAVIEFIKKENISSISFFGGEPLCNWKVVKKITEGLKDKKISWSITTNGTLLTQESIDLFKKYNFIINLSFDGTQKTQNEWRDKSYEKVVSNLPLLFQIPRERICILKTLVDIKTLYEDIKHIKELGFSGVYINQLDAFGPIGYDLKDLELFKEQYKKVLNDFHKKDGFQIYDIESWKSLISRNNVPSCGFTGKGLGISPKGKLSPCHQTPSFPEEIFSFGDVWKGIDHVKEKEIREMGKHSPKCLGCQYGLSKCLTTMWIKHGKFGVDAPEWSEIFEVAKIRIIEEFFGLKPKQPACAQKISPKPLKNLLLCTLINEEKYYILKPFLSQLSQIKYPFKTDYMIIVDKESNKLTFLLQSWIDGRLKGIPKPPKELSVKIVPLNTIPEEGNMFRIARGRNIALGIARQYHDYLMFLDADIILKDPETIEKLVSVKEGIVGALVKCRRNDREGWFNNYIKREGGGIVTLNYFKEGEILDVDATGSDCILISKDVFTKIFYEYKPEVPEAEDMGFCFKARKLGFNVKVHTGVLTQHLELDDIKI
jgi:radical SAM protein with 4Fe4S-binding SPASM domain